MLFANKRCDFVLCSLMCAITILPAVTSSTKLCPKDNYWYDDYNGKCRPCGVCKRKFLEIKPCSEFSNTMCIDPSAFTFLKKNAMKKLELTDSADNNKNGSSLSETSPPPTKHKWHEMETMDGDGLRKLHNNGDYNVQQVTLAAAQHQQSSRNNTEHQLKNYSVWDLCILSGLLVTLSAVMLAVFSMMIRQIDRFFTKKKGRNGIRNRLFSRDRLSTTEYMNSLATLDRRLAMDEILEKKKNAIFEPQLLAENLYSDEVFVNMSAPGHMGYRQQRHHQNHIHDYEELRLDDQQDHTHSLLRTTQH